MNVGLVFYVLFMVRGGRVFVIKVAILYSFFVL